MGKLRIFLILCLILTSSYKAMGRNDRSACLKHEYVDLDLPSGTLWAAMNIGAGSIEDEGDYFSWGEIVPKRLYGLSNYKYGEGIEDDEESFVPTKYNDNPKYPVVDSLYTLLPEDDAAFVVWGKEWRMPTMEDFAELLENCKWKWKRINGKYGYKVKSKNGNWIFLPTAGFKYDDLDYTYNSFYWTSTLREKNSQFALTFDFNPKIIEFKGAFRAEGHPIRPIRKK